MKTKYLSVSIALFLSLVILTRAASAQEKDHEEMERTEEIEREFQAKREMLEKQRQQMEEQREQLEQLHEERAREFERQARKSVIVRPGEPSTWHVAPDGSSYFFRTGDPGTQTQLTLRNSFRGGSDSSKGDFDVDESVGYIRCMINGKVRSGEIYIKVEYPDGKTFKELTINSSAEISFSQSLSIKEEEKKKYVGSWNYEVKADNAEGSYTLQIQTH